VSVNVKYALSEGIGATGPADCATAGPLLQ
jgi:hypothetical protein